MKRPNVLVILIDDLRHDELGVGGHPYMKTPHADRIAYEGALFERAFHTTPICSPNRASVMTGQYASRHGIIDNVARDAASHRLPNYHLALQALGYETAHVGKWHMGNDGRPRPGYDHWVSFDGHGRLNDPTLNVNGRYEEHPGYMTDVLNQAMALKQSDAAKAILDTIRPGSQEEIRLRAGMMAAVDEGVGTLFEALERSGALDDTIIVFFGDNGYFFGEHGLGPERRFPYEEGIRSPFLVRYPRRIKAGTRLRELVICQDLAPTFIELAGGRPGRQIQGRSLVPRFSGRRTAWRKSFLIEYWAENAMPWLVGMTYKAVRTDRHKYIHWVNKNRGHELDELYDLETDPFELRNLNRSRSHARVREKLRRELGRLVVEALGI